MDQCTHDIRSARWKNIIQRCQQRPSDQSVKRWLEENDILEQSYYYWQRKFRNEVYEQMDKNQLPSIQNTNNEVSFVEIATSSHSLPLADCSSDVIKPTAVIKTATMSIALSNDISDQLLSKLLQEVTHA